MSAADYESAPDVATAGYDSPVAERLHRAWEGKAGILGFLSTVDHKKLGMRYIVTAFAFLFAGGVEALIMRLQLAQPNGTTLTADAYNQLFSMHGITMIFLYAQPVLSGFSIFLFPLLLGTRDMAFPRLNALSYWIYLASGIFLYSSFLVGAAPNDGWFNYVPYALKEFNPGPNMDFYSLGIDLPRDLHDDGRHQLHRHLHAHPRPRHVDQPPAVHGVGHGDDLGRHPPGHAGGEPVVLLPVDGPATFGTHFYDTATDGQTAALAAPVLDLRPSRGSTLSSCRRWAWSPTVCRPSAGGRWSATPWSCSPRSRPWCSASASGCTTCSRPGCPISPCPSSAAPPSSSPCRAPSPSSPGSPPSGPAARC